MHRLIALLLVAVPICQAATASYDLIIRNGHIIDGTGSPWYAPDVGIMRADLVVFDPGAIRDVATYEDPNRFPEGMSFVLVNGVPVLEQGRMTGARPGKVLRGPGFQRQ
jgi:N-acyl-D-aspartate/D-glutamate deacylase